MTLGWGIIGLGRAADTLVAPGIAADANSRLVHVVSRDAGRGKAFADKHGAARSGTNFDAMLADKEVDVVAVTSPNAFHPDQIVAAARAGKHILADKPLAPNGAEAERVIDTCTAAGVRIGMNFQTRHHSCVLPAPGPARFCLRDLPCRLRQAHSPSRIALSVSEGGGEAGHRER